MMLPLVFQGGGAAFLYYSLHSRSDRLTAPQIDLPFSVPFLCPLGLTVSGFEILGVREPPFGQRGWFG
jgi:hypothetical protein